MGGLPQKIKNLFSLHFEDFSTGVDSTTSKSLRRSFLESSVAGVMGVFTGGIVLTGYAIALGANEFIFGLLTA
ncbi:MAG: hypothetical protein AABZ61_07130, partial [Bacteroidota bacterium]